MIKLTGNSGWSAFKKNIKNRVYSYFSGKAKSSRKLKLLMIFFTVFNSLSYQGVQQSS